MVSVCHETFLTLERESAALGASPIVYTRDQLLALGKPALPPGARPEIPKKRRRRRGCRAGIKAKERERRHKPAVPAIIMGNVRTLADNMDKVAALINYQREFRECSLLSFTETWLQSHIPDNSVAAPGFVAVRADRDVTGSGEKGGGIVLYVNERWCHPGHVCVKKRFCSPNIELLAVGIRPYYLPREFTSAIVVTVYIPSSADADAAADVIYNSVSRLQTKQPNAFIVINGDFNHVTLDKTLPDFIQFVDCPTRENNTCLLYANAQNAYSATALPPLGKSDHNLVLLMPKYVPLVQREPVSTRTVRRWTQEAEEALQDCFECTDWDALCQPHGDNIGDMMDCITEYIKFCEDTVMPPRNVRCFPNNKPWITCELKALLNDKKRALRSGDKEELRRVQHQLRHKIRECKDSYSRKLETELEQNNMTEVWSYERSQDVGGRGRLIEASLERELKELNTYFNRFSLTSPFHILQ